MTGGNTNHYTTADLIVLMMDCSLPKACIRLAENVAKRSDIDFLCTTSCSGRDHENFHQATELPYFHLMTQQSIFTVWLCSLLSTIHSGNHCSSDPVQVQSLSMLRSSNTHTLTHYVVPTLPRHFDLLHHCGCSIGFVFRRSEAPTP